MKYMFVIGKLARGGSERVLSILANQLVSSGHEVIVLIYNIFPNEYVLDTRVKKYYMPEINYSYSLLWKKNKKTLFRCLRYMRKLIHQESPDYLIPFYYSVQRDVMVSTICMKKRIVTTIRNNPVQFPVKRMTRWYRNVMALFSYKIYVQNESQKMYFPKLMRKKVFVLANPVADEFMEQGKEVYFENEEVHFVSVGRLTLQKNHKNMLDAFKMVLKKYPDSYLDIYGDDQLKERIESYIEELEISSSVKCGGRVENVAEVLKSKDIFVLSSDYEGMPNALMEALMVGIPCVSTDCPTGPSELIENGVTGLLVPIKNSEKLAEALEYMIENPEEAIQMGKKAREFMLQRYSSTQIAKQFCDFLN